MSVEAFHPSGAMGHPREVGFFTDDMPNKQPGSLLKITLTLAALAFGHIWPVSPSLSCTPAQIVAT